MATLASLRKEIIHASDAKRAEQSARFFKMNVGEYGEHDTFCGITVPVLRRIASGYFTLRLEDIVILLHSKTHEERLIALLLLVHIFQHSSNERKDMIYNLYMQHICCINNWDLVDVSADKIIGEYMKTHDRSILVILAHSDNVWERRISIVSTFQLIKDNKEYIDTFRIADILLHDRHDLIQKAVGWMLREVGKRISIDIEETYLIRRYKEMPRTMLRYAIERFPEEKRKAYLHSRI